jgi:hypothetical protein
MPQAWSGFGAGHFNLRGKLPPVPGNAQLVKGLFNESLPPFLAELDATGRRKPAIFRNITYLHIDCDLVNKFSVLHLWVAVTFTAGSGCGYFKIRQARHHWSPPMNGCNSRSCHAALMRCFCSMQYAGARDALALLSDRIHPGAVLVFDDLLAYPTYRCCTCVMHHAADQ